MTSLQNKMIEHIEDIWMELFKKNDGMVSLQEVGENFRDLTDIALDYLKSQKGVLVKETKFLTNILTAEYIDGLEIKPALQ